MHGNIVNGQSKHSSELKFFGNSKHFTRSNFILIDEIRFFVFFVFIDSLFENELNFVDRLIASDVRNNSAWNQRFFVLNHTGFTPDVIQREIKYVMNRIQLVKNNESTWNFLRGLLQHGNGKLDQYPEVGFQYIARIKKFVYLFDRRINYLQEKVHCEFCLFH